MIRNSGMIMRVYFVGIKGVGMAGLAIMVKEAGFEVRGSDVKEEFITDEVLLKHKMGIDNGFDPELLKKFVKNKPEEVLVVTTAAHEGLDNPQCVKARELGVQILTHGQAVGFFMEGNLFSRKFIGISVLGCHGKTTITAMAALSLSNAGLDPSWAVGTSEIFPEGDAGHFGRGDYFIVEADEFISDANKDKTVKFLYQHPEFAIINNIDFDHPDVFKDLNEVKATFLKFCLEKIKQKGVLIVNGDDQNTKFIIHNPEFRTRRNDLKIISYGEEEDNDIRIENFKEIGWGSEFEVTNKGESLGIFKLFVPGYYNAKNALSVIVLMKEVGIELDIIKSSISKFQGTKRRQEKIGETQGGSLVIDDYAHHPDEIVKTIAAVKKAYPDKKIICLFQPHTLGRTVALEKQFANAFSGVEEVLFLPIFTSKREGEVNYEQLYSSIKKIMQDSGLKNYFPKDSRTHDEIDDPPYLYKKNRKAVIKYLQDKFDSPGFVILTLGAGDLYRIAYNLLNKHA
jgi:UDP-N-acetylmuramate--alanine ligase